ncbi:SDR family oxidoreductase [Candidatus Dojkabacteria bacterium]|nr:SDR family oxidoreductase [Candidatus Dojkabacteria bacterium]
MKLGIKNKVIVVTGGANGIGEAIVRGLYAEGALPVIVDKDYKKAKKIAKELNGINSPGVFKCDLADHLMTESVIEDICNLYPEIYGLVNNAGVNDGVGLDADISQFESSLCKNLTHYFQMTKGFIEKIKREEGSIVNISSKVSLTGQGGTSGYAAAKGAINSLTREWAVELAPYNVDVNCIIPAEVMTPQYQKWISQDKSASVRLSHIVQKINLGHRLTQPEEIANYALFLLSDKSSHFTGQWVFVDGGYTHLDDSKEYE